MSAAVASARANPAYDAECAEQHASASIDAVLVDYPGKSIHAHPALFDAPSTLSALLQNCRGGWIKLADAPLLVEAVERATGFDKEYYEGISLVEYSSGKPKTNFVAYDLKSERGRQQTLKRGQRMFTVSLFLTNHFELDFFRMSSPPHALSAGDCICYKNTIGDSEERDPELERRVVCKKGIGYMAEIYVRHRRHRPPKT